MTDQQKAAYRYLARKGLEVNMDKVFYVISIINSCVNKEQLDLTMDWAYSLLGKSMTFIHIQNNYNWKLEGLRV